MVLGAAASPDVADDADDLPAQAIRPGSSREPHAMADRVATGPELSRRRGAGQQNRRRAAPVAGVKEPAAQQRDAERREISSAGDARLDVAIIFSRALRRRALDDERARETEPAQGQPEDRARGTGAGEGRETVEEAAIQERHPLAVRVLRLGQGKVELEDVGGPKAGVGRSHPDEAPDQQPGAGQENQGQRQLGDDQQAADAASPAIQRAGPPGAA
jgi:hypothetical protein